MPVNPVHRLATLALVAALTVGLFPSAQAVIPSVSVKPMTLISHLEKQKMAQGLLVKKDLIYLFGTTAGSENSDGYVQAISAQGEVKWTLALDTGGDDIATAGSFDSYGNIWIAGASAAPVTDNENEATTYNPSSALNPDSITVVPKIPLRADSNFVTAWLVSPKGNLLATYSTNVGRVTLASGISISTTTVSIVGVASTALGSSGFLIQSTRKGIFGKILLIGKRDTEINSLTRSGRNLLLFGSSSETLFGKSRAGTRDGLIATFSSSGKFISMIRSFNANSSRSWQNGTSSFFVGGDAVAGSKIEAVVTKYATTLTPRWSTRYLSAGPAMTLDFLSSHLLFFPSIGPINGVKYWKPTKAQLLSLIVDKNGLLVGAFSFKGATSPIAVAYSRELGAVLLSQGPAGVSVFHALTL